MLIDVRDVTHGFDGRPPVLRDLTVRLDEHRIGVIGANGSGKSTFARMLNGLVVPEHGTVTLDGLDTTRQGKQVRRRVGFCFTDPDSQIVMPTVAEDVAFSLRRRGLTRTEVDARVEAALAAHGLAGRGDHPAHLLSGGQKQLLAISGVLVMQPAYVVFDEPTTLLDLRNRNRIVQVIRELPQTVIAVTHDLDLLSDFERVLVFDGGRIVKDAPPHEAVPFYRELMAR